MIEASNPLSMARRSRTEVCESGIVRTHPVVIVNERPPCTSSVDRGDDDELYEEMDDEEDDHGNCLDNALKPSGASDEEQHGVMRPGVIPLAAPYQSRPRCAVCHRFQEGDIRLFRWPRDIKIRRKWCAFFGIDDAELAVNLDSSYVCSWHFDPDQFLYSDHKVYWAPDVCPRHKIRRPADLEPFPWELSYSANGVPKGLGTIEGRSGSRKRSRLPPAKSTVIFFRQSKYRIAGKTKHPVAVLRLPNDPMFCYEFSYNRTSHIDGTKFYACLQCRKAKTETRVKDYIRTIHLDGTRLLSRGDPFAGHHFACKPIFDAPHHNDPQGIIVSPAVCEERTERAMCNPCPSMSKPRVCVPSGSVQPPHLSPIRTMAEQVIQHQTVHAAFKHRAFDQAQPRAIDENETDEFYVDNSRYSLDERRAKIDDWVEREEEVKETSDSVRGSLFTRQLPYRHVLKRRYTPMARSMPVARCHICHRVLGDTVELISHLKWHVRASPVCRRCSQRCDAASSLQSRSSRICHSCLATTTRHRSFLQIPIAIDESIQDAAGLNDEQHSSSHQQAMSRRTKDQLIVVD